MFNDQTHGFFEDFSSKFGKWTSVQDGNLASSWYLRGSKPTENAFQVKWRLIQLDGKYPVKRFLAQPLCYDRYVVRFTMQFFRETLLQGVKNEGWKEINQQTPAVLPLQFLWLNMANHGYGYKHVTQSNVGKKTIINHPWLGMIYTSYLWWNWGFLLVLPSWRPPLRLELPVAGRELPLSGPYALVYDGKVWGWWKLGISWKQIMKDMLVGGFNPFWKIYVRQLGLLFPIHGKI